MNAEMGVSQLPAACAGQRLQYPGEYTRMWCAPSPLDAVGILWYCTYLECANPNPNPQRKIPRERESAWVSAWVSARERERERERETPRYQPDSLHPTLGILHPCVHVCVHVCVRVCACARVWGVWGGVGGVGGGDDVQERRGGALLLHPLCSCCASGYCLEVFTTLLLCILLLCTLLLCATTIAPALFMLCLWLLP